MIVVGILWLIAFLMWAASYAHWSAFRDAPYGARTAGWTALWSFAALLVLTWLAH